ncbi:hypothetical protein [Actinomadura sp. 21ATH]|uniref:hypothetical protein n=1 Tax=Actinomadura sp. 21ATH TaxID=1735444 RepID=UPI0035BF4589
MRFDAWQIVGMLLVALGVQGGARQVLDGEAGLLGGLPGGDAAVLALYVAAAVVGAVLAGWAYARAKALGRRK